MPQLGLVKYWPDKIRLQSWKNKFGHKFGKNWLKNLEKKLAEKSDTQLLLPTRFPHCSCTPDHHPIYVQ